MGTFSLSNRVFHTVTTNTTRAQSQAENPLHCLYFKDFLKIVYRHPARLK